MTPPSCMPEVSETVLSANPVWKDVEAGVVIYRSAWAGSSSGALRIEIRIEVPFRDGEALLDHIEEEMRGNVSSIAIPESIRCASKTEFDLLDLFSRVVRGPA